MSENSLERHELNERDKKLCAHIAELVVNKDINTAEELFRLAIQILHINPETVSLMRMWMKGSLRENHGLSPDNIPSFIQQDNRAERNHEAQEQNWLDIMAEKLTNDIQNTCYKVDKKTIHIISTPETILGIVDESLGRANTPEKKEILNKTIKNFELLWQSCSFLAKITTPEEFHYFEMLSILATQVIKILSKFVKKNSKLN